MRGALRGAGGAFGQLAPHRAAGDEGRQELVFTWRAKQHNKGSTTQPGLSRHIKAARQRAQPEAQHSRPRYCWAASSPLPAAGGHGAGSASGRITVQQFSALPCPCCAGDLLL